MSERDGNLVPGLDVPDPDLAEEFAEQAGTDPTPAEIDAYLELEGEAPLGEERPLDDVVGGLEETS